MHWGIDLGGTKIEGVVVHSVANPEAICRIRIDTEAQQGYEHILSRVVHLVDQMKKETGRSPDRIGIGHPGVVDPKTQLLKNSNTICLNDRPVKAALERALELPVVMMNDANCFALAEAKLGAARNAKVAFGIIAGTGVGGGVVINGEALYGCQGIAGEWGHNVLVEDGPQCYCGKRGCVETIFAGPALEAFYQQRSGQKLRMKEILERANDKSDVHAQATLDRLHIYFGRAISYVINILDPDVIVVGGGLSNIDSLYTEGVEEAKRCIFNNRFETKVVRNQLGDSAGVFGAAMLTAS